MDILCQLTHTIEFVSIESGIMTWYCLTCNREILENEDGGF